MDLSHSRDPVAVMNARRATVVNSGHVWIEAALISSTGPVVYADSRQSRSAAAEILCALLAMRRAGAVIIIRWAAYSRTIPC